MHWRGQTTSVIAVGPFPLAGERDHQQVDVRQDDRDRGPGKKQIQDAGKDLSQVELVGAESSQKSAPQRRQILAAQV